MCSMNDFLVKDFNHDISQYGVLNHHYSQPTQIFIIEKKDSMESQNWGPNMKNEVHIPHS